MLQRLDTPVALGLSSSVWVGVGAALQLRKTLAVSASRPDTPGAMVNVGIMMELEEFDAWW